MTLETSQLGESSSFDSVSVKFNSSMIPVEIRVKGKKKTDTRWRRIEVRMFSMYLDSKQVTDLREEEEVVGGIGKE